MTVLLTALRLDIRMAAAHQLYTLGAFVAVLLGLVGRFLVPADSLPLALPAFYFVALGGTTFMFGSAMLLLDRTQGTLLALRVSPMTSGAYLASKALSLATFALVESLLTWALLPSGGPAMNLPLLFGAVWLLGLLYTLLGLGQVAPHHNVTSFLMPDAVVLTSLLQLPLLALVGVGPAWLVALAPSTGPLALMVAATTGTSFLSVPLAAALTAGWLLAATAWARLRLRHHVQLPEA